MEATKTNLDSIVAKFENEPYIGIDTETYGLKWDDRLFSLILYAPNVGGCYFDFKDTLDYDELTLLQEKLFSKEDITWFFHNAPYDVRRLAIEGCEIKGKIHCTLAQARLVENCHMTYSLDACLKRIGQAKNDKVMECIKKRRLYTIVESPIKKKKEKILHFDQVPLDILVEYGIADAKGTFDLGMYQKDMLYKNTQVSFRKKASALYENELKLTKVITEIEDVGIQIDRDYCERGLEWELSKAQVCIDKLTEIAGESYKSGPIWLKKVFDLKGYKYKTNSDTGNPCFDKNELEAMNNPISKLIKELRHHENYARNFYHSFLTHADSDGVVHASIKQGGTDTGRFSYSNPNMQNVPKEENYTGLEFIVRKSFIPREGFVFVAIDYDQQEFRLMLDYAGERKLIQRIVEEGLDVHEATAQMMGVTRKEAKTLNFGLLYGMGPAKLAVALGVPQEKARLLRERYFDALPNVRRFVYNCIERCKMKKEIYTWAGRRLMFPNVNFGYKGPNHLIQGGCGDIMRVAMTRIQDYLRPLRSRILVTIHDELLLEVHKDEIEIFLGVKNIMESVYEGANGMKLTCGVEHSWVSFGQCDMKEGGPI